MIEIDALVRIREQAPDTAVIVVSGESTLENALRAGQRGAAADVLRSKVNTAQGGAATALVDVYGYLF